MSYVNKVSSANHSHRRQRHLHNDVSEQQSYGEFEQSANGNFGRNDNQNDHYPRLRNKSLAEAFLTSDQILARIMAIFASLVFTIIIISFRPFDTSNVADTVGSGGDVLNQVGYIAIVAIMLFLLLTQTSPRRLLSFATPIWGLFLIAIFAALMQNPSPVDAMRAVVLTLFAGFAAFSVLVLPHSRPDLRLTIMLTAIIILTLSYAGLVLLPNAAKHGYSAFEAQHFGLWRGPFPHKNIAGPIMSMLAIFGLYIWRSGNPIIGALITILAFIFVLNTGSKTTTGFLPLSIMVIMVAGIFASPRLAVLATLMVISVVAALSIGTIFSDSLKDITASLLGDATFTGRVSLWKHGIYTFLANPITGMGFNNFWTTDTVVNGPLPSYAEWDIRDIVHGHNNYIDLLLNYGLIGGGIILYVMFILPMRNYVKAYKKGNDRKLADMFMMMIVFSMLLSFMETFILHRSDPIWIFHIFAVVGLQMLSYQGKIKKRRRTKRASAAR